MIEVAAKGGHVGVVGAEGGLADLQGSLEVAAGAGQVTKHAEHPAEFVVPGCHPAVIWTIGGLVDRQSQFEVVAGGLVVPASRSARPSSSCRLPTVG
jgi:hypothetical protein